MSPSMLNTPSVTISLTRSLSAFSAKQHRLEFAQVAVLVDEALRLGEADGVDDRGVVERVGEDGVLRRGGERRDEADVRVPATDVGQRRLAAEELADLPLQLEVAGHGAA